MKSINIILALLLASAGLSAQTIAPTQTDVIIIDNGTSGKADPADRIRYTVTIMNTAGPGATGVQLNAVPDPRTTFVAGSFRSSPLAVADSYTATGNVGINVSAANGLKTNDFDDALAGATLSCGTCISANGGTVVVNNDGSFTYMPAPGFTGADNFTYTMTDSNPVGLPVPLTDVATVTITVSNLIWFINNTGGGTGGDGRLTSPFKTIADFNTGSTAAASVVYIEHTGSNYTGPLTLQTGERLYGEGHSAGGNLSGVLGFSLAPNSNTLPTLTAGNRPIITSPLGGITLATNNEIRGLEVGNTSLGKIIGTSFGTLLVGNTTTPDVLLSGTGPAIDLVTGTFVATSQLISTSSSSGNRPISLESVDGTVNFGTGTITGSTNAAFYVLNGTATITYSGSITPSSLLAVNIINHETGNITLQTGNISSTAGGISIFGCNSATILFSNPTISLSTTTTNAVNLDQNAGATINFNPAGGGNGLDITTTTGIGFNATGGATAVNVIGSGNTINSTSAPALNVNATTIGASNLNFVSISSGNNTAATDPANGIVLNTTGATGALLVTGDGSTDGSGGTIQNITGRGGEFISTNNLSLKFINFTNANTSNGGTCTDLSTSGCNAAIYMSSVSTALLDNINITGTTVQEGINGLTVSNLTMTNCNVFNCGNEIEEGCVKMRGLTGTCAITNCDLAFPGADVMEIVNASGSLLLNINNSSFRDSQSSASGNTGLQARAEGTSSIIVNANNSNFLRIRTVGLHATAITNGSNDVDVTGCTFDPGTGTMIGLDLDADNNGILKFNVQNNPKIYSRNGPAINVFGDTNASIDGRINNNPDVQVKNNVGSNVGSGIRANINKDATARIEVKTNVVNVGSDDAGIDLTGIGRVSANAGGATKTLNATVTGNNVTIGATSTYGIFIISASNAADNNAICVNVANNTVIRNPSSIASFRARVPSATGFFFMEGFSSNAENTWNTKGNLPMSVGGSEVSYGGSGTFGTCTTVLPTNPVLSPAN